MDMIAFEMILKQKPHFFVVAFCLTTIPETHLT